jgi:hypothetical protein
MTLRVLLAGALGGLVMFVWGFVFWAVSPLPSKYLPEVPQDAALRRALDDALPTSGTYVFPSRSESRETMKERHAQGPVGVVAFHKGGVDMEDPSIFLKGYLHFAACAVIAAGIMSTVVGSLRAYGSRALFVFRLGLFAGVAIELGKTIWWNAPMDFLLLNCAFHFVGWGLVGLAVAGIVKPPAAAPTT